MNAEGRAEGDCPAPLVEGETFTKTFASRERSIYWDGIKAERLENGELVKSGKGLLRVEMVMLSLAGVPLENLSYPMLETLRFMMKFALAFLPFLIVARLTRPMDKDLLDFFYGRLRTPAVADRELDAAEMELTRADPQRFDHLKMFPNSNFEFSKWDRYERKGIVKIMIWVSLIYVLLIIIANLGA